MHIIDELAYASKLYHVHPSYKCIMAVMCLCFCVGTRSITIAILVLCCMSFMSIGMGGVHILRYLKLFRIPLLFLVMSTITIMLEIDVIPFSTHSIQIGSLYVGIRTSTVMFAMQLFLTALASVSCLFFLSLSTPMTEILQLLKVVHIPFLLIELMLLIYRLIFVINDMASHLRIAQHARLANHNFASRVQSAGMLLSTLFLRSFRKSSRLYDAMEARCYDGEIKIIRLQYSLPRKYIVYIMILLLLFLVATILYVQKMIV